MSKIPFEAYLFAAMVSLFVFMGWFLVSTQREYEQAHPYITARDCVAACAPLRVAYFKLGYREYDRACACKAPAQLEQP